ncbi:MAG: copper amine oxidase N-terminal domain-containing protein [Acetobacteraceae bacterium]|nr:copper amine oxidase N-terminal domain-containing protein [Acetobacteraceae bacterium]
MRKLWAMVLVVAVLCGSGIVYASARGTYQGYPVVGVVVNGRELQPEVPAIIFNGKTLLPLRAVTEALGAKVEWDAATVTATVTLPRDITAEELPAWREGLNARLAAVWGDYVSLLAERDAQAVDPAAYSERLLALTRAAWDALQEGTAVTSSRDLEVWGSIVGTAAVAALMFSDIAFRIAHDVGGEEPLGEPCDLAHQAIQKLLESFGEGPPPGSQGEGRSQGCIKSMSLGLLPQEYAAREDWPWHVVPATVFSPGDLMVVQGELLQDVELVTKCYDLQAQRFLETGEGRMSLRKGGFAGCSPVTLPPGRYEVWVFIGDELVMKLPFEVR